ncbi:PilN domain-containing protein [Acidisoma cladoniae]|uniref:PilN domain-containing protein n=1 Tax=Acidisoma cladoniae TaxID=3040935 RepID=UPI00254D4343|nr:PilN domain-containing protein [Acidisoma sp. PAMC 29798]
MINQFMGWWARQLLSLLPDRMRGREADEGQGFLISLVSVPGATHDTVDVSPHTGSRHGAFERLLLDDSGLARLRALRARAPRAVVRLRLRAGSLLERDVVLPLAAERGLDQVLQYEMDRLTPFTAAETFWGWTVTRRDRAHARLHLRLTLGPRGAVAPIIDTLASAGARPALLEAPATPEGDRVRRIDLSSREGKGGARVTPALRAGIALCAVLLLALIGLPFLRQSIALGDVGARIAALRPTVAEAARLRRDIEAQAAGGSMLAAARQQVGDPLRAIAAVTNALPDDSWLTDLTLQQRKLRIDGESRTAVQLIARLAADPTIIDPAFAAPVTRDDSTHADLFSISADVAP